MGITKFSRSLFSVTQFNMMSSFSIFMFSHAHFHVLPCSSKSKSTHVASVIERVAQVRASFVNEHCLPFILAEDRLDYAKRVSEDKVALEKTTISRTSASYITTHGVARCLKDELKLKLKDRK